MVDLAAAIAPTRGGGCAIDVEVVPGASESRFPAGYNAWRARIEAKVRAPPEDGQANAELLRLVAEALGVAPARVRLTSGATSRRKTVSVEGLAADEAARRLATASSHEERT